MAREDGLDFVTDKYGRIARGRENALRSLQLQALVYADRIEQALELAESLRLVEELAPEAMLIIAYATALRTSNSADAVAAFEDLAQRAGSPERGERDYRARVALFRGKLLERVGDASGAEEAFREASQTQAYHRHALCCHERALEGLLAKRPADQSAATRLADVRKALRSLARTGDFG